MSPLAHAVQEYLALRRALGYKLKLHGLLLPQFVESRASRSVVDHDRVGA